MLKRICSKGQILFVLEQKHKKYYNKEKNVVEKLKSIYDYSDS